MSNNASNHIKPARKWYLLSIFLFFLGPAFAGYLLYKTFTATVHTSTFFIPGNSQILIVEPGQYTLWTETKAVKTAEAVTQDLKNIVLTFAHPETKQSFTLIPKIGWSDTKDQVSHYSLGTISFNKPGNYQVSATSQKLMLPYKVWVREPSLIKVLTALGWSFFLTILSVILAVLSAIIILIKRINAQNIMTQEAKPENSTLPPAATPDNQATTWAMICHLSGFAGFLFPFGNIIAPLLIWGFKREIPYLDEQGKEAINFQISIAIFYVIAIVLILLIIGLFLLPLIAAFHIIAMIIASIEVAQGKHFRYPLTIRLLK